jgi:AraC-like DNA-binding protein
MEVRTTKTTITRRDRARRQAAIREEHAFLSDVCGYRDKRIAARLGISEHTLTKALQESTDGETYAEAA